MDIDPGLAELEQEWRRLRLVKFDKLVPPRFADPVPMPQPVRGWLDDVTSASGDVGRNLLMVGPIGTGKTHLAWQLARAYLVRVAADVAVLTATELVQAVRGDGSDQAITRLQSTSLLVLDDMGASALTPWVADALFAVIDYRYRWMRSTVITSNEASLREALGERVASRLSQSAVVVPMTGADRRRESP